MKISSWGYAPLVSAAVFAAGIGVGLMAAPPAGALSNTSEIITGGASLAQGSTDRWTSPGVSNIYTNDFPAAGLGEQASQIQFTHGTLSKFRASLTTANAPTGGSFTLMVRVNGQDTGLTCTLLGSGTCSAGNQAKALSNTSLIAIRVLNSLTDTGNLAFTYSMLYD